MSVATSDPRVPPCCTSFPQRNRGVSSVRSSVSYRLGRFTRDIFPMSAVFRWKNAGCVALVLLLLASGWGASIDSPPSGPAIYNTEHWIPLSHTNDPTYTMGALKPLPPVSESWKDPTSLIFVGIIHYRDRRCSTTLANLFANAKNPERIRVGKAVLILPWLSYNPSNGASCMQVLSSKFRPRKTATPASNNIAA